jgi:hypothetical protein
VSDWLTAQGGASVPAARFGGNDLPPDIIAFGHILAETHAEVAEIKRKSDGLVLGLFGYDALIGLIPVIGGVYSAVNGFNLLRHAIRAKCGSGTIFFGIVLVVIDIIIGFSPVYGDIADALFRGHAFFANRILDTTQQKLYAIHAARDAAQSGSLTNGDMVALKDILHRGGRTEQSAQIRSYILLGVFGFLLFSCVQEYRERQDAIRACKAQGGWFCSMRY